MPVTQNQKINSNKTLLILLHVGFLLIGIITVLLGQVLPILSARLALNDQEAGWFFIAQFSGSLLGTFFYNRTIKKFGYLPMLLGSFCLISLGCGGINFNSLFWLVKCPGQRLFPNHHLHRQKCIAG
jgi:fucose permease